MSCMGIMMKGFIKGFNKKIADFFVVKERELEIQIGLPTDVKHVGHIGFDGGNGAAPSWMGEFKTGPNFASTSIGVPLTSIPAPAPETITETTEGSVAPKKRRKKHRKSKSSSSSTSTSSTRTSGGGSTRTSSKKRRPKTRLTEEGHAKQR